MTEIIIKDHSKRIIVKGRNGSIYRKQNSSVCGGGQVQRLFSETGFFAFFYCAPPPPYVYIAPYNHDPTAHYGPELIFFSQIYKLSAKRLLIKDEETWIY